MPRPRARRSSSAIEIADVANGASPTPQASSQLARASATGRPMSAPAIPARSSGIAGRQYVSPQPTTPSEILEPDDAVGVRVAPRIRGAHPRRELPAQAEHLRALDPGHRPSPQLSAHGFDGRRGKSASTSGRAPCRFTMTSGSTASSSPSVRWPSSRWVTSSPGRETSPGCSGRPAPRRPGRGGPARSGGAGRSDSCRGRDRRSAGQAANVRDGPRAPARSGGGTPVVRQADGPRGRPAPRGERPPVELVRRVLGAQLEHDRRGGLAGEGREQTRQDLRPMPAGAELELPDADRRPSRGQRRDEPDRRAVHLDERNIRPDRARRPMAPDLVPPDRRVARACDEVPPDRLPVEHLEERDVAGPGRSQPNRGPGRRPTTAFGRCVDRQPAIPGKRGSYPNCG